MKSARKIENGADVVEFLKMQHEQVKSLFGDVIDAKGPQRAQLFRQLCDLLAAHEAGEEAVVHPTAARTIENGDEVVAERLAEERKANAAIAKLKTLDVSSKEFDTQIRALRRAVLAHAEHEEKEEFDELETLVDAKGLANMQAAVVATERGQQKPVTRERTSSY